MANGCPWCVLHFMSVNLILAENKKIEAFAFTVCVFYLQMCLLNIELLVFLCICYIRPVI